MRLFVALMLHIKAASWEQCLGLLKDKNFIQNVKNFDIESITPMQLEMIRTKYTRTAKFRPNELRKCSMALYYLSIRVHGIDNYWSEKEL